MAFIYLASPYTDPDTGIMEARFKAAMEATADLLAESQWVYSPIVHCHELAKQYKLPRDFSFWRAYNFAMLAKASQLLVFQLPGWELSKGVAAEIDLARQLSIPTFATKYRPSLADLYERV